MAEKEGVVPGGSFLCSLPTDIQAAWHTAKAFYMAQAGWKAAWIGGGPGKCWVALGSSSQTQDPQPPDSPQGHLGKGVDRSALLQESWAPSLPT